MKNKWFIRIYYLAIEFKSAVVSFWKIEKNIVWKADR